MRSRHAFRFAPLLVAVAAAACASATRSTGARAERAWPWPLATTVADSVRTTVLSPAVRLHELVHLEGPWRSAVLEVDLAACVTLRAVKGASTAVGRRPTSALLAALPAEHRPLAAVNADFFSFAPPGVPTGAHVEQGVLLAGPGTRPVLVVDGAGRVAFAALRAGGWVRRQRDSVPLDAWNRWPSAGLTLLDGRWGVPLDSTVAARQVWALVPVANGGHRVLSIAPPLRAQGDTVLLVAPNAGVATEAGARWLDGLAAGDTVRLAPALSRPDVREAVGGFPVLLTDGSEPAALATAGAESFRARNPRTAVGLSHGGRRLLLVAVDGRQPAWSVGTTLSETALLMRRLGATEALNLDGGGSSALVVRAGDSVRVVNRPSDPTGERAVGNGLAVLGRC